MPRELDDLKTIIEMVNAPLVQQFTHTLANQEELRRAVDQIAQTQIKLEEKVKVVEEDANKIQERLDSLEKNILDNQKQRFRQVITIQATLLVLIASAFLSYMVPILLQIFHR